MITITVEKAKFVHKRCRAYEELLKKINAYIAKNTLVFEALDTEHGTLSYLEVSEVPEGLIGELSGAFCPSRGVLGIIITHVSAFEVFDCTTTFHARMARLRRIEEQLKHIVATTNRKQKEPSL